MNIYIKVLAILYFLHSQKLCTSVKHNRLSCDEVNKELIAMGVIIENIPEGTLDLSFQNVFRFHTCFFYIFIILFNRSLKQIPAITKFVTIEAEKLQKLQILCPNA